MADVNTTESLSLTKWLTTDELPGGCTLQPTIRNNQFAESTEYTLNHGDEKGQKRYCCWSPIIAVSLKGDQYASGHKWVRFTGYVASSGDYMKSKYIRTLVPAKIYDAFREASMRKDGTLLAPDVKAVHRTPEYVTMLIQLRDWRQSTTVDEAGTAVYNCTVGAGVGQEVPINKVQLAAKSEPGGVNHIRGKFQARFSLTVHGPIGETIDTLESIRTHHKVVLKMVVAQFAVSAFEPMDCLNVSEASGPANAFANTDRRVLDRLRAMGMDVTQVAPHSPSADTA